MELKEQNLMMTSTGAAQIKSRKLLLTSISFTAWKRRRTSSTSWSTTCRSKQRSTFRLGYYWSWCSIPAYSVSISWYWRDVMMLSSFNFAKRIFSSQTRPSERRWQPSRWIFLLSSSWFYFYTVCDRNIQLRFRSYLLNNPLSQHSPFNIVSI